MTKALEKYPFHRIALLNPGAGLGDHMLCLPAMRALQTHYPTAKLDLLTNEKTSAIQPLLIPGIQFVPIKTGNRLLQLLSTFKALKRGRYDAVAYLGYSGWIQLLLKLLNIPVRAGYLTGKSSSLLLNRGVAIQPEAYVAYQHLAVVKALCNLPRQPFKAELETEEGVLPDTCTQADTHTQDENLPRLDKSFFSTTITDCEAVNCIHSVGQAPKILIHPGVSQASQKKRYLKAWPVESWKSLIEKLLTMHATAHVFLLGGSDDERIISELSSYSQLLPSSLSQRIHTLYGQTKSVTDLAMALSAGTVLVSVDSFPMHLAVAVKTPVVAIFASTDEKKYLPKTPGTVAVSRPDLPCRPCLWDKRKHSCQKPVCLDVSVDQVLQAIQQQLRDVNAIK
jgi:ADP-heptose:LPS heptosyltransferase